MTPNEANLHYDLKPSPNEFLDFTIGQYLVQLSWAEDKWCKLDSNLNLQTFYFHIGKVTNLDGMILRKFIIWKLDITWGRLDQ